jgi:hypothetical protein
MDTNTIAVTISAGTAIAALLMFLKALFERWVKPADPLHDPTIRLLAALVGAVGFLLHAQLVHPLTGTTAWDAVAQGVFAGLSAIVTFHVLTSPTTPTSTP